MLSVVHCPTSTLVLFAMYPFKMFVKVTHRILRYTVL